MDEPNRSPQVITTPSGDELVVLPRRDSDALMDALTEAQEELADVAALDQRLAETSTQSIPPMPADVSSLLLAGHRRLAALRLWREMSQIELARRAGLQEEHLVQLQSGERIPEPTDVAALAVALSVPEAWLAP